MNCSHNGEERGSSVYEASLYTSITHLYVSLVYLHLFSHIRRVFFLISLIFYFSTQFQFFTFSSCDPLFYSNSGCQPMMSTALTSVSLPYKSSLMDCGLDYPALLLLWLISKPPSCFLAFKLPGCAENYSSIFKSHFDTSEC